MVELSSSGLKSFGWACVGPDASPLSPIVLPDDAGGVEVSGAGMLLGGDATEPLVPGESPVVGAGGVSARSQPASRAMSIAEDNVEAKTERTGNMSISFAVLRILIVVSDFVLGKD